MCLIAFAYRQHPAYPLVFAANRDEFYERPTAPADFWPEAPGVLAGRDLLAGGTWCGVTRTGRFAALTNVRDPRRLRHGAPTRGRLVADFLTGEASPEAYLAQVAAAAARYNGFNLIVGDATAVAYLSSDDPTVRRLAPGVYGLSNDRLDTPWPKVVRARDGLSALLPAPVLTPEPLFTLLADETRAPDALLPDTGVGTAWERLLSPVFIASPAYGTRASTVFWIDGAGHVDFFERTHAPGRPPVERAFAFDVVPEAVAPAGVNTR